MRHLDLTEDGARLLSACHTHVRPVEADLQTGATAADLATVRAWLCRINIMP